MREAPVAEQPPRADGLRRCAARRGEMIARIIAALTLMLGIASSASAECAWVLWSQTTVVNKSMTWAVQRAYAESNQCNVVAQSMAEEFAKTEKGTVTQLRIGPEVVVIGGTVRYACLPDTVDPRGPKGSTRGAPLVSRLPTARVGCA